MHNVKVESTWFMDHGGGMPATNFHFLLFNLIRKADPINKEKLRKGFPAEVAFHEYWMATGEYPEMVVVPDE
jgi:hypothetical protein